MRLTRQSCILFISTFPPRKCGIASFTEDLVTAIRNEVNDDIHVSVCALDKKNTTHSYEHPVSMRMDSYAMDSCMETAVRISRDESLKLLCVEHEFGLYGGTYGEFLIDFLAMSEKPYIIRFHTVLPDPDAKRLRVVRDLSLNANKVMVMTRHSAKILVTDYGIAEDKIAIIPHGTHLHSDITPIELKLKYDLHGRLVLTNFGLLGPNKGIEKSIMAMKQISAKFPQAIFLILGQTHPVLLERDGESYREYLQQLVVENNLENNVRMVNEYIPIHVLMEYLTLTDIYLFTSKDPHQAMSGTFLYAMSAGCPIISNSFVLAKEMLDDDTGIILAGNDENELASRAMYLLENEELRKKMSRNAFLKTRNTTWGKVAGKHNQVFREILGTSFDTQAMPGQVIH